MSIGLQSRRPRPGDREQATRGKWQTRVCDNRTTTEPKLKNRTASSLLRLAFYANSGSGFHYYCAHIPESLVFLSYIAHLRVLRTVLKEHCSRYHLLVNDSPHLAWLRQVEAQAAQAIAAITQKEHRRDFLVFAIGTCMITSCIYFCYRSPRSYCRAMRILTRPSSSFLLW